jgi:vacuolar-type H+-ATPase subunit I/STV1
MPTVTESDLKEIKDLIIDLKINQVRMEEKLSGQLLALEEKLSGQVATLDERLSGQINTLDKKVSGIDKRLDIIERRVNGLTGWLIGILFAFVGHSRKNCFLP